MADALPCTADTGYYCPVGSTDPAGVACPALYWCPGTIRDKKACEATEGNYCPVGTGSKDGVPCVAGYFCVGGQSDKAPCTSLQGNYCAVGSYQENGVICPAGSACIGMILFLKLCIAVDDKIEFSKISQIITSISEPEI